jgi:hypothetical protein
MPVGGHLSKPHTHHPDYRPDAHPSGDAPIGESRRTDTQRGRPTWAPIIRPLPASALSKPRTVLKGRRNDPSVAFIAWSQATGQIDHPDNCDHALREKGPRSGAIGRLAACALEQPSDAGSEGYRGTDAKHQHLPPDRGHAMGVVHPVFAHAPSVAGLGHFHASDSAPRGLAGQRLVPQGTAGEHEQRAKYDCGRPAPRS